MVEKKGMWQRIWRAAMGEPALDEEDWLEEDEEDAVLSAKEGAVKSEARAAAIALPTR